MIYQVLLYQQMSYYSIVLFCTDSASWSRWSVDGRRSLGATHITDQYELLMSQFRSFCLYDAGEIRHTCDYLDQMTSTLVQLMNKMTVLQNRMIRKLDKITIVMDQMIKALDPMTTILDQWPMQWKECLIDRVTLSWLAKAPDLERKYTINYISSQTGPDHRTGPNDKSNQIKWPVFYHYSHCIIYKPVHTALSSFSLSDQTHYPYHNDHITLHTNIIVLLYTVNTPETITP